LLEDKIVAVGASILPKKQRGKPEKDDPETVTTRPPLTDPVQGDREVKIEVSV
jgi:hypothetical protein